MNIVRIPRLPRPGWPEITGVTTVTAGGGLFVHQRADLHHNRLTREQKRDEALKLERLTPQQYVMYSALDNRPANEVRESLVASGVTHKGHDYSDADSFHIETVYSPTGNPVKDAVHIKKKSLRLEVYEREELELGRRGGGCTPSALVEERLVEDKPEMEARGYRYSPNISYEISEQLLEDPRPVAYSFTATVPYRTPDSAFYVGAFFLGVVGVFLYKYVKRRFSNWTDSGDSQESSSMLEEAVSVEETTKVQGAGKGLEANEGPVKEGTAEVFLETIKSCRRKAITKKDAVYILDAYYGFSEEEALQLLRALHSINLEIKAESLVALVGGSGSGKSTLLRVIAGLETPDEGRVWLSGRNATALSVQEREIGFVFQNYALFKDMTVYENIAFGLDIRNLTATTVKNRVTQLLQLVQLEKLAGRYPSQLSGGQRQRVALARALAIEPKVLLLDEPFGALDSKVRRGLRQWLRQLHDQVPVTTVFVTHDQQEALEVASDIVILEQGQISQMGPPQDMYHFLYSP